VKKVKNTIPVYDIPSIGGHNQITGNIIACPFAQYLEIHPNLQAPHRHDFYHILLFTKGAGHHTIDFEQFEVVKGQIYFMIPGQVHSWNFTGQPDGYIINFHESLLQSFTYNQRYAEQFSFFNGVARDSVINLPGEIFNTIKELFIEIVAEVKNASAYSRDMICAKLVALFIAVQRSAGSSDVHPAQGVSPLYSFRQLVEKYYAEKHLPKEYAAMLYITPNHLNAICKNQLGKPAGEIIRDRLLLEAKRLLINANLNIADISNQLNFTDNSYFTKFFRKYTSITPEQFRKTFFKQAKQ
jgi:AraC family transcriptional regulator, transcriptional activator of pobA